MIGTGTGFVARGAAVSVAGASDPGRVRSDNEDRLFFDVERGLFVVADGVGGRAAGEVASAIAVDVIPASLLRSVGTPGHRLRDAIARANNEIHRQAQATPAQRGMTCVLTAALLTGDTLTVGQVGDSRLYKITPGGIVKVTRDHSPVGEREDSGELSEEEAMRHPRRNEVYRDVGAVPHAPDDSEFVEIVETSFDPESAFLLCSDGLTDMVPSSVINGIVRRHAGRPADAVAALVDAANEAGGHDNITVVYGEGVRFAAALAEAARPAEPVEAGGRRGRLAVAGWLLAGIVVGLALAFGLAIAVGALPDGLTGRTLVVGGTATGYGSIGEAMAAAGPRDVVQIEPGTYQEQVVLADGVAVRASVPGSVKLTAPPGRLGWVSLVSNGARGNVISGLSIVGTPEAPISVGLQLGGSAASIDDVTLEGNIDVGIDVQNDGATLVRASRFRDVQGVPMRIGGSAHPVLRQNLFVQGAHERGPAIHVQDEASPTLDGNVFVGYAQAIGAPPSRREHLLRGNYVITSDEPDAPQGSAP